MDNIWEVIEQERIVEGDTKLYESLNPESGWKNPEENLQNKFGNRWFAVGTHIKTRAS